MNRRDLAFTNHQSPITNHLPARSAPDDDPSDFFSGMIFWGGFNWSLELTNTEQFCTSCHTMREYLFKEYKKSVHYANRTGVRASCPDCHKGISHTLPKGYDNNPLTDELHDRMENEDIECRLCHEDMASAPKVEGW